MKGTAEADRQRDASPDTEAPSATTQTDPQSSRRRVKRKRRVVRKEKGKDAKGYSCRCRSIRADDSFQPGWRND